MTKEAVEAKLSQLRESRRQLLENLTAHNGAIEVLEQLLLVAEAEEPEVPLEPVLRAVEGDEN